MKEKQFDAVFTKAASLEPSAEVSAEELKKINRFTLAALKAEDVFTFSVVLCDNELDRTYDHFTDKSLSDMQKLFVGKTVIKDHARSADNQIARIYDTEIIAPNGEADPYRQLKARCYMVRLDSNADLIREIEAGIKKEGSVSFRLKHYYCGICGADNAERLCLHWPGRKYNTDSGVKTCTFTIDGISDAYEFSLVAVPAQPAAGACKGLDEDEDNTDKKDGDIQRRLLNSRIKAVKTFINSHKKED